MAEGVRSKLIQKRIFDNFDSLFDRSPDMTRLVVDILSLVMEDGIYFPLAYQIIGSHEGRRYCWKYARPDSIGRQVTTTQR